MDLKIDKIKSSKAEHICSFLLSLLPIIFFLGSGVANTVVIIIDLLFIYILIKNKELSFFRNSIFYLLIIFWLVLLISLLLSINFENSFGRSFGFVRFIFLVLATQYFFCKENFEFKNFILKIWSIFIFIISFDLIFEVIFGFNTLGFSSYMPGRLSGFFNQELKIGNLYSAFYLIVMSFIISIKFSFFKFNSKFLKFLQNNYLYLFMLFFVIISIFIGERSNLIRVIFMSVIFTFLVDEKLIKNLNLVTISLLISIVILMSSQNYQWRYWDAFLKPLINNPIKYVESSYYGAHYKTAIQVYKNNKIYGVGLKNYRIEVKKEKYTNLASIHPHQVHFEILAELGLFGYIFFICFMVSSIFISLKSYLKTKDYFVLSGLLYVVAVLLPILPTGSFFTSFGATLFWLNYALMTSRSVLYSKKNE